MVLYVLVSMKIYYACRTALLITALISGNLKISNIDIHIGSFTTKGYQADKLPVPCKTMYQKYFSTFI